MAFVEEILHIYNLIKDFKPSEENTLPENSYFLSDEYILCKDRKYGDSRYPYTNDGLTLWAHSSGNIQVNESNFFIFNPTLEGKQPSISFFGGIKNEDGKYDFVSISGNADHPLSMDAERYTIYHKNSAYYLRVYKDVLFALKTGVDKEKNILFSLSAINLTDEKKDVYLTSYFNPLLIHGDNDCEESKWFKKCELKNYGASLLTIEDLSRTIHLYNYAIIKRATSEFANISSTTSRQIFASKKHNHIILSEGLRTGEFDTQKDITLFNDTAIFADIVKSTLTEGERFNVTYCLYQAKNEDEVKTIEEKPYSLLSNEFAFSNAELDSSLNKTNKLKIEFGEFNDLPINNVLFNRFIHSVCNQVDYCAKAKNSSLSLLGVRDVYQMIEASLIWDKEVAREKILQSLNFIDKNGRAPRQHSLPKDATTFTMDNREFIDQNQWIISTLYQYLAFTNDTSILDEECNFTKLIGRNVGEFYEEKGSVLQHLIAMSKYLISHIDEENKCIHTLYGDWNDAVDGLGTSKDTDKKFGNGVSAMATMHLYKNLHEIKAIYNLIGKEDDLDLDKHIKDVKEGINKHIIVIKGEEKRIIHGWGEDKEFYVGSFNDVDNISRDSLTSNAFYVISKMIETKPELKQTILDAYSRLDSKYGYLTFSHDFKRENASKVGRIVNLPKGTAENAATYIHSSIFAIRSLLLMNEADVAYKQLAKVLPITHKALTHSPFVMPNSYVYNPEIGVDGESMNDWYTGSSNTIIKALVFDLFGINPELGNIINLKPVNKFPSDNASIELDIKNKHFVIIYENKHNDKRVITLNGKVIGNSFTTDECKETNIIRIED